MKIKLIYARRRVITALHPEEWMEGAKLHSFLKVTALLTVLPFTAAAFITQVESVATRKKPVNDEFTVN